MLTSSTTCPKVATCTIYMIAVNMPWKYTVLSARERDLACVLNGLRHESLNDTLKRWTGVQAHVWSWYRYLSEGWCCSTISEVPTACPRLPLSTRDLQKTKTYLKHGRKHGTDARELVEVSLGLGQAVGHQDRLFCAVLVCMPKSFYFLRRLRVRIPLPAHFCFLFCT